MRAAIRCQPIARSCFQVDPILIVGVNSGDRRGQMRSVIGDDDPLPIETVVTPGWKLVAAPMTEKLTV